MRYEIDIDNDSNDLFEINADNVAEIRVHNKNGNDISEEAFVEIYLSRNALLGLGTELIRMAHNFKEGKHVHLEPVSVEQQIQRMGVFLTPSSSETMICCNENKCVDEYIKKDEKEK